MILGGGDCFLETAVPAGVGGDRDQQQQQQGVL
jgi:hypothetical protein